MDETSASEPDLIKRARNGDKAAFAGLVRRYQDYIYNAAVHMVGRWQDAEDLTQQVFLKAFRGISGFRQKSRFTTWLYSIMLNCVRSFWRRQDRAPHEVSLDSGGDADGSAPDPRGPSSDKPLNRLLSKERVQVVRDAIQQLDPNMKEVVVLRDIQGLSYREVATCLDLPLGTVKSRLARARRALRDEIARIFHESSVRQM
ncbi:MAG: sigma-70 family RNA polymerase sigma factor [Planctomycetota bacterium]